MMAAVVQAVLYPREGGASPLVPGSHAVLWDLVVCNCTSLPGPQSEEVAWRLQPLPLQKVVADPILMSLLICLIDSFE